MKLIRTKTRGVGTETYRAPEVNSGLDYDPAAADVWSLGVTLFFFVSIIFLLYFYCCIEGIFTVRFPFRTNIVHGGQKIESNKISSKNSCM